MILTPRKSLIVPSRRIVTPRRKQGGYVGFYSAGAMGSAGPPPTSGFWDAIAATNPELWLRLNDATGPTAVNSGSGLDGTCNGTIAFSQGPLVDNQPGASSIATAASGDYVRTDTNGFSASGLIGICYAGTGDGNTTARILWRTIFSNTGAAYLRIDTSNITIQPNSSPGALDTGVPSATVKDGDPHLIMVGRLAESPTTLRLWIDGVEVWTYSLGAGSLFVSNDFIIGRNGSSAQYCYGRYADAFIKIAAPSAAEVSAINSAWAAP